MTGQFNTFSQASTAPLHSKPDPKLQTRQSVPATNPEGLDPIEASKQLAAYAAVDQHILPHHRVIGIGSGSTVPYVVERIVQQGHETNESRWFIPTGFQSKELIVKAGLNLGDVDQFPRLDITLDGADEVDADLNAIKGGGACHLREKVLAEAADKFILVADARKDSALLGTNWRAGVPIEVVPFAWAKVMSNIQLMGCPHPTLRMGKSKAGPVVTDNGNFVIDAPFDDIYMRDPSELSYRLKMLTGVLEVGLFCGMAQEAYFGNSDGTVTIRSKNGKTRKMSVEEGKLKIRSNGLTPHHLLHPLNSSASKP
ncbi:ribose 5-phosphate isomerase A [Puccinia graminis f. sp. tritici CRL 75-36-700-3]|uniref:Ribose-5-phosphate isomerase n=1 Tax=Puccinia graminis f. sp. tritici (strain CRL 75-36-700-3 / race SCCL) TaxID=418459 RepID=E3KHK5_PUCGT|nr:ribose 5-phosphate isomerase A [Puccinia graminis f. sp. tritici CRL 75-36-700-3]EFP83780.1 ribose 5-phosphate isomerase A [Puccinia graminis f. sp. tritici CRL 75-36-700-3]